MLAYLPDKIKKMHFPKPVKIIYHLRSIGYCLIKIKIFFQLFTYTLQVMIQSSFIKQASFLTFSTGVSHHARSSANKCNWLMTRFLQVYQEQNGYQASDMQAVCRRVKTNISRGHFPGKLFL